MHRGRRTKPQLTLGKELPKGAQGDLRKVASAEFSKDTFTLHIVYDDKKWRVATLTDLAWSTCVNDLERVREDEKILQKWLDLEQNNKTKSEGDEDG